MKNRTKIKNLTDAKKEKLKEVLNIESEYVEYDVVDNVITLIGNNKEISATIDRKEVAPDETYELLKEITITLESEALSKPIVINWLQDHGNMWIAQRFINSLITVPRQGNGLSAANKIKLKEEIARYRASLKKKESSIDLEA